MADESKQPHDDQRVEELLSQLQGIFSKLSKSEEKESRDKIAPPVEPSTRPDPFASPTVPPPPAQNAPSLTPVVPAPPSPLEETTILPAPTFFEEEKKSAPAETLFIVEPTSSPMTALPAPTPPPVAAPELPATPPVVVTSPLAAPPLPSPSMPAFEGVSPVSVPLVIDPSRPSASEMPVEDPERRNVAIAVFYPEGREAEAKLLGQKVESLSPKFTKVSFRLVARHFAPYNLKVEWRDRVLADVQAFQIQAVFFLEERALEEVRKKTLAADLDALGVYLQEVPMLSVEKKAFYTDVLLGLVFFFDTHKPQA